MIKLSAYNSFASVYDLLTRDVNYRQRADYICSLLCDYGKPDGILLDAACGTGSLSELFAEKGYQVIGADSSFEMLNEAQSKKFVSNLDILYLNQDIRELDLYGTIECAVCSLDSVNHLSSVADMEKAFHSIGFFMEKDGIFIFDVNTLYKHEKILADNVFVFDEDEVYCVWQNEYIPAEKKTNINLDLFFPEKDSYRRETENFSERFFSDEELTSALCKADFEVLARFGDMTSLPPSPLEQRIYYVCKKLKDQ